MKKIKRIPVTKEGFQRLKDELESLKSERPSAVKTLADARSMGDLSENGLYTAAKARLRSIDNQIFRLEIQIKLADIAESNGTGLAEIGSKVEVRDGDVSKTFELVGDYEANPMEGKISQNSPLGRALKGKKSGDTAVFDAPSGQITYVITKVS